MFKINTSKSKFRKKFRAKSNRIGSLACTFPRIYSGMLGLKATSFGLVSMSSLISFYKDINKKIKKQGICRIFTFPNKKTTTKGLGCRMGQGKGIKPFYFCYIYSGMLLCLVTVSIKQKGIFALQSACYKLNISCCIIEY